jgi:hypothetical protein
MILASRLSRKVVENRFLLLVIFLLASMFPNAVAIGKATITVVSPNGGEIWPIGGVQTIRWTSSSVTGNVRIDLSRNGGSSWSTIMASTANDGSEPWTVTGPTTTGARIRIVSLANLAISDMSDRDFIIGTIAFRVQGENGKLLSGIVVTLFTGQRTLSGTTDTSGMIAFDASCSTTLVSDPNKVYYNYLFSERFCRTGPYVYTVTLSRVRIPSTSLWQIYAATDITPRDVAALGWSLFKSFTPRQLKTVADVASKVSSAIEAANFAVDCMAPAIGLDSSVCIPAGLLIYQISQMAPSPTDIVYSMLKTVLKVDDDTLVGMYTKRGEPPIFVRFPWVRILSPNGWEVWNIGTTQIIKWESVAVTGNVRIDLSRDGGSTWTAIIANTPNDGSETWTVTGSPTTRARIRVVSLANTAIWDMSDRDFTIRDVTPPTVRVISPNGGEAWKVGETRSIKWTASDNVGVTRIDIFYSTDGGKSWKTIATGLSNTGSYNWVVPNTPSTNCLVRVDAYDAAGNKGSDASDKSFTIRK